MAGRTGSALLPLHGGHVPGWLADRMTRLGAAMSQAIVHHYGRHELLRRVQPNTPVASAAHSRAAQSRSIVPPAHPSVERDAARFSESRNYVARASWMDVSSASSPQRSAY
jgi:hypothetical protein